MAQMSLQEQLLQAGLTNEKKAKKAKKASKKTRDLKREVKAATEEKRLAQLAKDKELNEQIKQQAQAKAIQAQIKQLIEMNMLDTSHGNIAYNFTDGTAVKKLTVSDKIQRQLANGLLSIVRFGETGTDDYAVIPSVVAEKIALRDDSVLVSQNEIQEVEEDDPYADYVIPDDLMW
ncbi:DUF2058 domain-containing protein [Psychrosphaera sp. F3M07]|uniref:DUF2058 domain-containing protein n=1 Tax=Psychrosphaera sp. F3M07 TaxID=2841560 RepID=UPI001C093420|nr:DUF2058 domain-containing protein [Psychrosphaera sp. F3M07]MBU2916560.1 DUF2058 domain-containing protein [Psychrosphaera sp. F3M07]